MSDSAPHIFVSPLMSARIDQWPATPQGILATETVQGHHAFWAARIPYIPATPLPEGLNANQRIGWLLTRQTSFLYNLVQIANDSSTFELRYIADPRPGTEARVSLILLGKTFRTDPMEAERYARGQWERVSAFFPSEAPYYYPLAPITQESDPRGTPAWEAQGFMHWFEPISDADLNEGRYGLVELRKSEDWPNRHVALHDVDYIPHHFVPPVDYTGMTRLLEALSRQSRTAYVSIALRPQRLAPRERSEIARFAEYYHRAASGKLVDDSPAITAQRRLDQNAFDAIFRQRAELGQQVFGTLNEQSEALALITVRVLAEPNALTALTQTMGSEIFANTGQSYPCTYEVVAPRDAQERFWAIFNMRWLEMERWGISPRLQRFRDLWRLRFLVTMPEALAAFRMPSASPGTHLPGMDVSDEPFTSVPTNTPAPDDVTGLGQVTVNGVARAIEYRLPRAEFAHGVNILGDESANRGEVVAALVDYLHTRRIPSIVFGPRESLTIQTLVASIGDSGAQRPATYPDAPPPFTPPEGVPLARWISAVARALALAFAMPTTACLALQTALMNAFVVAGGVPNAPWDQRLSAPDTAEVATALNNEVTSMQLSAEVRRLFTDQLLPGLSELRYAPALKMSRAFPTPNSPVFILSDSIEMYQSAVARSALTCASGAIALEREARAEPSLVPNAPRAALVLVEPHHLFPASRSGDQPLLPLIEGLRQAQASVIMVSARPHLIDRATFAGIMTAQRLTLADSITTCQQLMQLNDREAQRLPVLDARDTLWQHGGTAVLVRRTIKGPVRMEAPQKQPLLDTTVGETHE